MKVLIAPDSFGGTLSSVEAARAMAAGWRQARPADEVAVVPMADGGEGTLEAVAAAVPDAESVAAEVADARGIAVPARWLRLPDGRALVEVAAAIGLWRLEPDRRDPLQATSYGAGQLIAAALDAGATEVIVGLGGSATVDGGAGMATALGHRLLRDDGNGVKVGAAFLDLLERIDVAPAPGAPLVAATDVTNPLLGPRGAAAVYGPQKGASQQDVGVLEARLTHLADIVERDVPGGPWRDLPGAGAAGGLGFGLAAFCGAELRAGVATVAQLVGLEGHLEGVDVILTGEGALDEQSVQGKVCGALLEAARHDGCRVLVIAGRFADGVEQVFDDARELGPSGLTQAAALVKERACALAEETT